jgi:pimeloyl-ACP methyl ester carboxylesterase
VSSKPAHFVFVHGGGHGAWCWYKTVDLLRRAGHKATAVDLISCGRDCTDPNHVESFLDYNEPLMELLSNLPDNDKIILVGHDLGGLSVTYAMEHFHDKISAAIFLAAMMLPSGYPLTFDVRFLPPTSPPPSLLSSEAAVSVRFHMVVHTIGSYI